MVRRHIVIAVLAAALVLTLGVLLALLVLPGPRDVQASGVGMFGYGLLNLTTSQR